jgi:hypothetical protein
MLPKPRLEMLKITSPAFKVPNQESVCVLGFTGNPPTVQAQKNVRREEGNALVAIDKRVVHQQRLEEGSSHLGELGVVARSRPMDRALQEAEISDA